MQKKGDLTTVARSPESGGAAALRLGRGRRRRCGGAPGSGRRQRGSGEHGGAYGAGGVLECVPTRWGGAAGVAAADDALGSRMNATFWWSLGSGKTTKACYATTGTRWCPRGRLPCLGATTTGGRSRACSGDPRVSLELVDLPHRKFTGGVTVVHEGTGDRMDTVSALIGY